MGEKVQCRHPRCSMNQPTFKDFCAKASRGAWCHIFPEGRIWQASLPVPPHAGARCAPASASVTRLRPDYPPFWSRHIADGPAQLRWRVRNQADAAAAAAAAAAAMAATVASRQPWKLRSEGRVLGPLRPGAVHRSNEACGSGGGAFVRRRGRTVLHSCRPVPPYPLPWPASLVSWPARGGA